MKTISRYIMTLALLITAVTGAWATEPRVINSEIDFEALKVGDIIVEGFSMTGPKSVMFYFNAGRAKKGETLLNEDVSFYRMYISSVGTNAVITLSANAGDAAGTYTPIDENGQVANAWIVTSTNESGNSDFHLSGYKYVAPNAEPTIEVKWDAKAKTGSFTMPAYDVEIAPIYAPVAQWAKVENEDQIPTAIEGIIAGEAKDIVKAGTVAKVGSTENAQGTLMYLVTTTKEQPTSTTGFNATVPTGAVLTGSYTENQTVYVWYYIKGIDAAEGEDATAENTFNDSEICTEPITVTVLSNKFDINFKAANDNTIETGKATVKVGETAAEVNEGKLTGVKMNSKVTVTAKDGYKFRKVEVKKGGAKPTLAATLTTAGMTVKVSFLLVGNAETVNFTSNGDGTYTKTGGTGNTATAPDWIIQLVENSGMIVFKAYPDDENENGKTAFKFNFFPSDNTYYMWAGNQARDLEPTFTSISVNDTAIAVTEAQDN
jgi:hypothetical protein